MSAITVLTDEYGLEREYTEVARKAAVGERIKIVHKWPDDGRYENGAVFTASRVRAYDGYVYADKIGERVIAMPEYVVLESSNVVIIDGERYNVVDRKAVVGERVVVLAPNCAIDYGKGDVFDARSIINGEGSVLICDRVGHSNCLRIDEYRVLVPVEASTPPHTVVDDVATLTLRVTELERQVASLKTPKTVTPTINVNVTSPSSGKSDDIADMLRRAFGAKTPKPLSRDAIVEMAKKDVAERFVDGNKGVGTVIWGHAGHNTVEFVVDREKGTVKAVLRLAYASSRTVGEGTAICDPDDCFNVHIGKAIALRRALGDGVPTEYGKVPQPTEKDVRVGDIVLATMGIHSGEKGVVNAIKPTHSLRNGREFVSSDKGLTFICGSSDIWAHIHNVKVVDDSRDGGRQ